MAAGNIKRVAVYLSGSYNQLLNYFTGSGKGSPEATIYGGVGSRYIRTDAAGPLSSVFVKATGTAKTGWFAGVCEEFAGTQLIAQAGAVVLVGGVLTHPVAGNGGAVTAVTMSTGVVVGHKVCLLGTDATNTVQLADNAGNVKLGAATRTLALNDYLYLVWDGTNWCERGFAAIG